MIRIENLEKSYKIYQKQPGLKGSIKSLFTRQYQEKVAISNINLTISRGETVGLVGSNGAGKTTLVKILSGIIHPGKGTVEVLGYNPWMRHNEYRQKIALIMGQKAQLWWDLPAMDSFMLLKEIYQIPEKTFQYNLEYLSEYLSIQDQLNIQVRRLSLGERMKVELIACLLHNPEVIFLDEPTIGLDLIAQKAVRSFLKQYQKDRNPIIILTSHYMQDIQELCPRVVVMKKGQLVFDGKRSELLSYIGSQRLLKVPLIGMKSVEHLAQNQWYKNLNGKIQDDILTLQVPPNEIGQTIAEISQTLDLSQMSITNIDIADHIESLMKSDLNASGHS